MAPLAAKNFKQTQPITTGLRIICESYPANTCLREILQNGDDAGATEIEYVLDTKSYLDGPLLYDALQAYHGPALLVRNNSVFTEEDFGSLSSVGDSRKREDAAATGKFGLGFNSVYHWTDGPWIYSRNWLLMLDPHESWSGETGKPGGPAWDVIENHESIELHNHMKTFSAFGLDFSKEFNETIIRVPLRTSDQARSSKIVPREISLDEIQEALSLFGQEMKDGGLLFLKHIRKIILRIDSDVVAQIEILEDNSNNLKVRNELPADFKRLYVQQASSAVQEDISKCFELKIRHSAGATSSVAHYLVQHTMMKSSGDRGLDKWARGRKLFPWTAVAAPLNDSLLGDAFEGRLFCVLRMPILTNHPVHIHGLWSITPDRSRLSSSGQSKGFEDEATNWNKFMFQKCTSSSWANLLHHRNQFSWKEEGFRLWPHITFSPIDFWSRLDDWVIDKAISEKLSVWNTSTNCVSMDQAFFFRADDESHIYASAMDQITLPAVYLSQDILRKAQQQAQVLSVSLRVASPTVIRQFLHTNKYVIKPDISSLVLEYCLLDSLKGRIKPGSKSNFYSSLKGVPIWPTLSGNLTDSGDLLLPRNSDEMNLFTKARTQKTINISKLEPRVLGLLWKDIAHLSTLMRFRTLSDLQVDWQIIYPLKNNSQYSDFFRERPCESDEILGKIWRWIYTTKLPNEHLPSTLQRLWLIPINSFRLRHYLPGDESPLMLIEDKRGPFYQSMADDFSRKDANTPAILDSKALPQEAVAFFRAQANMVPEFRGACQKNFSPLVSWLAANSELIRTATDQQKSTILKDLESLSKKSGFAAINPVNQENLRALPLYSRVLSKSPYDKRTIMMSDLTSCKHALKIPDGLPPMPDIPDVAFYDFSNPIEKYLADTFSLVQNMSLETLIQDHLLPWAKENSGKAKDSLIDFVFAYPESRHLSSSCIDLIANCPMVPISVSTSNGEKQYHCLTNLIHPRSVLSKLYFEEEKVFPEKEFLKKHSSALITYGIKYQPTWHDFYDRVQYISQCGADTNKLVDKVEYLLGLPIPGLISDSSILNSIRDLRWLPGTPVTGGPLTLLSPKTCRGPALKDLTDLVFGSIGFSPQKDWTKILGWDERIEKNILFLQLDAALAEELHDKVNRILKYLDPSDYSDLSQKPCIPSSRKKYGDPHSMFLPNSLLANHPMTPFLNEVDVFFASDHRPLITALNIRRQPVLQDILNVLRHLEASTQFLDESQLGVAISALEIATQLYEADELTNILIPDTENILRELPEIVHGSCNITGIATKFHFTHPGVSNKVIERLEVENSLARATRLNIDFEDEDEDEYTPGEKLTNIIADTLGRYPVDSTFNEYLANADDCGSTQISWILDKCSDGPYSSVKLLTPDLEPLQGPALFVYNNGVFSENDFAGFKDIGRGSKFDDITSTGMFGRGALSMYHFTDVPMIVSGESFLILDPQQELLPRNKRYKRKVGIKISLSLAKRICPDQLIPFDGLCGFSSNMEKYEGTLFRFCFRKSKETKLKDITTAINSEEVELLLHRYFQDADMAVLFLRHIDSISFSIRGEDSPIWSVSADRPENSDDIVFRQIRVSSQKAGHEDDSKTWRVGMIDIESCPADIVKPGRAAGKITECGVAACMSHPNTSQRVFCALPTTFLSHLPISFHASFAITGDRKTIPFENVRRDPETTRWNKWLLTSCIPEFYLEFLKDLAPRLGEDSFKYWPISKPTGDLDDMSDYVVEAFWKKLEEYDTWQLYPLAESLSTSSTTNNVSPLKTRPGIKKRKLYTTTSMKAAQFDLLPSKYVHLRPLFLDLCPTLVRFPERLRRDLKKCKALQSVTQLEPVMLCNIFRQEVNCQHISKFLSSMDKPARVRTMEMLLEVVVPPLLDDPEALNILVGCRILPRLDESLGLLVSNSEPDVEWNFMATTTEQSLFDFAASSFVDTRLYQPLSTVQMLMPTQYVTSTETVRNPIKEIAKSSLNVRQLQAVDIGVLLRSSKSPINLGKTKSRDQWIEKFWQHANMSLRSVDDAVPCKLDSKVVNDLVLKCGLQDQKIYRVKTGNEWQYLTPNEFEDEPCIIQPMTKEHCVLCSEIPQLKLVDRNCVPRAYLLKSTENDLNTMDSFARLLRAFRSFESQPHSPIVTCLSDKLTAESRKVLRELVVNYVETKQITAGDQVILRSLPIWPCLGGQSSPELMSFTSAENGRFHKDAIMLLPWVKDLGTFVDPKVAQPVERVLKSLGVTFMTVSQVWDHIKGDFPTNRKDWNLKSYQRFVHHLAHHKLYPSSSSIAPNGHGDFCLPSTLYDHKDPIFFAAFRKMEDTKFLHPDLRSDVFHIFWINVGLRVRVNEVMKSADFLQCALAIEARDAEIEKKSVFKQDAETVAKYLVWDTLNFRQWPSNIWSRLCKVQMFHVADNIQDNFTYRQARMQDLADNKSHRCLDDMGREKDKRIVWSQKPFFKHKPVPYVFEASPNRGFVSAETVLDHLKYLVDIRKNIEVADLPEYLKDIQASYDYLQDQVDFTKNIKNLWKAKIWVNVDTTEVDEISSEDIESSLTSASLLCMNCPTDPLPSKVARKFLIPYERLLKALGCPSVTQPPRTKPPPTNPTLPMDATMAEIRNLRDQREFIDIVFEAEGVQKPAHKIFMVAVSQYCRAQSLGEWGRQLEQQRGVIRIEDMRYKTLSDMVDFAYAGTVNWPPLTDPMDTDEVASRLDELLDLLQATDRWFLDRLHQLAEDYIIDHGDLYVRADNVLEVRELADASQALRLRDHCDIFVANNASFVDALSQSRSP